MKKWIIKTIFLSLSPYEKWTCRNFLKMPSIDEILVDQARLIDKNWPKSATYKATQSKGDKP